MPTIKKEKQLASKLQQVLDQFLDELKVQGAILSVHSEKQALSWTGSVGNLSVYQPYFLTSVAKLNLTALVLKLRFRGMLELDDPVTYFLPKEISNNLLVIKKKDYSDKITLAHLLAHRSGLPDYFQIPFQNQGTLKEALFSGKDQKWTFNDLLDNIKKAGPEFQPGQKNRIHYADTNFQLLGRIIEIITAQPLQKTIEDFHLKPLNLTQTYLYNDTKDRTPVPFYFEDKPLLIPKAMTSFGPTGGLVSTANDYMVFLKAFFHGHLFPEEYLKEIQVWQPLGKGLYYGIGISKFVKPRLFMPFSSKEQFIGHSGTSGAFALYQPEKKVYFTGTVNQAGDQTLPFRLALKVMKVLNEEK